MDMNGRGTRKAVEQIFAILVTGILLAGCSGGGETPSTSVSAVSSYLADMQGGGFVGKLSSVTSNSARASIDTATPDATANTYTISSAYKMLTGGIWGADTTVTAPPYYLSTTGWVLLSSADTTTLVDSGDGSNMTFSYPGLSGALTVTKTSLDGTGIACTTGSGTATACAAPGSYPAGASSYSASFTYLTDFYGLYGSAPITDTAGVVLTALPALGSTFCLPDLSVVLAPITPAPVAGSNNYNVYWIAAASCSSASAIATTLAGTPHSTVLISNQDTGNAVVPSVLTLKSWTGSWASINTTYGAYTLGARAGNVWYGYFYAGGVEITGGTPSYNKTALNAQLQAYGLTALP